MLPLVQMHHMVQSPSHLDSGSPFMSSHGKQVDHHGHPQHPHASRMSSSLHSLFASHRAFPIRASQPPQSFQQSRLSENNEYHLRRKTPNGTIDAGYDGTPAQLASGPPPLKHMILPSSSYRAPSTAYVTEPRHYDGLDMNMQTYGGGGWPYGSRSNVGLDCAPNVPLTSYNPYNNGVRIPTVLQPMYHQDPGPAVFNNGGLLPVPAWPIDASLQGLQPAAVAQPSYYAVNRHAWSANLPADPMMQSRTPGGLGSPFDMNHGGYQAPSQRLESLSLEPNRLDTPESSSPARFREKALTNAHRTYVELLAYLHQTRKTHSGRTSGASRPSSKIVLIPPKLSKSSSPSNMMLGQHLSDNQHTYASMMGSGMRASSFMSPSQVGSKNHLPAGGEIGNQAYYYLLNTDGSLHGTGDLARRLITNTPVSNARNAADMLYNLCEQSGWKWIDGMLLGGCLYYGLERYEQALDWFHRIIAIDAHHIEALSNVAATLYCLHRNEEAEKYWLQAVRQKPSYLEAVEHLVGLLCSAQRSREAVDIIDYVQRSLCLPKTNSLNGNWDGNMSGQQADSSRDPQHEKPGFGSSGYEVPGCENGRMVALIHAKGNMLYALKEIDRASEAFEEAVLISAGRKLRCIQSLIRRIESVLGAPDPYSAIQRISSTNHLLLPPEKARHTARLVFPSNGELPGLRFMAQGGLKRNAIGVTSNALLSLAKIFQDGMANGGSSPAVLRQPPEIGDILALYYLSLSLSESPSTANNVGILLASVPNQQAAIPESARTQMLPGIIPGSGLALAFAYYQYGLSLDRKHVHLHTNLGSLLKDIGQLDLAISMYEKAVACDPTFDIALTNLANAVKDRGRINDAIGYYRRAVQSNPHFAEAVCGLSTALNSVCDWQGRGGVILHGGKYDRWHVDEQGILQDSIILGYGSGLMSRVVEIVAKQLTESSHWGVGVLQSGILDPFIAQFRAAGADRTDRGVNLELELHRWAGRPWEGSRLLRLVERSIKAAMRLWYRDKYIHKIASSYPRPRPPASLSVPSAPTVLPFHTFTCPLTAKEIRQIAQRNALRISCSTLRSAWLPNTVYPPPPPPQPHLNIAYVSSDFNNHPLAHLMQSVFGMHNPTRAKAFCYATTASDKSVHRQQIEHEAPVFYDASSWSAEKLVSQIVKDNIHILVNLNGYTRGARNEIFAARPAPIQMSFMGFAGTLGAEWCDYLLADETAVPPSTLRPSRANLSLQDVFHDEESAEEDGWMYSENIIFCRDTFFCCDHAQSCEAGEREVTWEEEQERRWKMRKELFPHLSDDTIIMGNFNQLYKIDPSTFRVWLRILAAVPKAVLWLLRFPETGEVNLRRTAKLWATDEVASRIIFTDVAPKQQHISRARVCDIFLDTPECNAHTTAADILWSSTPLLTLPRYPYKMCSRMAASILRGALPKSEEGLQVARELIAADDDDYEAMAIRLAGGLTYRLSNGRYGIGQGRLAEMRKVLFDAKWTCGLFNTRRWVSDLEDAYDEAWRRWVTGKAGDIHLSEIPKGRRVR